MKRIPRKTLFILSIFVFIIVVCMSGGSEAFSASAPNVLTVPASMDDTGQPHYSYNGHLVTFKAIVQGADSATQYYFRWDINGDGNWDQLTGRTYANSAGRWYTGKGTDLSGQQYLPDITEERKLVHGVIEVATGINTSTGAPVDSRFGSYPILQYRDLSPADPDRLDDTQQSILKNIAMEDALWYLHQQFVRVEATGAGATGYITNKAANESNDVRVANTALFVLAMAENGHYAAFPAGSDLFDTSALNERNDTLYNTDPYAEDLSRAVNYLLNNLAELTVSELDKSDDGVGRIDGGVSNSGLHIPFYTVPEINSNSLVLSALAKSRLTGSRVGASSSMVNGLPFELIIQRVVDAGIAAQIDENNPITQGGWTYYPANNNQVVAAEAVNPLISGGWIYALHTAEKEMGASGVYINNRLKDRLANHVVQNQSTDGGCNYNGMSVFSPVGNYLLACKWLGWDLWDASDQTPAGYTSTSITKGEARQVYDKYLQYVIDHWEMPYDSSKGYHGGYLWAGGDYDGADYLACLEGTSSSMLYSRSLYGIRDFSEYDEPPLVYFGSNEWIKQFSVSLIKGRHASGYYREETNSFDLNNLGLPGTTAYAAMAGGDLYPEVISKVSITTAGLPEGTVGSEYSYQLAATDGLQENYIWHIFGLPEGLTYDGNTGEISGTPTPEGNYTLNVSVSDGLSTDSGTFNLSVRAGKLTITTDSLSTGIAGESNSYNLAAIGGVAPYTWQAANLPLGLSIDAFAGAISGIPIETGQFSIDVTVTDSESIVAQKTLSLQLNAYKPLTIATKQLPIAYVSSPYSMNLKADGGKAPFHWSESGLPEGLSLNASSGEVSGTPVSEGTYPVSLTVEDGVGTTTQANLTLTVRLVNITTTELPPVYWGEQEQTYSFTMSATGGTAPYTWSCTLYEQNSDLPLSIHSGYGFDSDTGRLYGTTRVGNQPPAGDILIRATDAYGKYDEKRYAWDSYPDFAHITTTTIPNGFIDQEYTVQLKAANAYGDEHFVWSAENLPAGFVINETTGTISGTAAEAGEYRTKVTVHLPDDSSRWISQFFYFYILEPLSIDTPNLPQGSVNTGFCYALEAQGGMLPYPFLDECSWTASGLPPGININEETGIIYGVPSEGGTFPVTIGLHDSEGNYASKILDIKIAGLNKYSIHSVSLQKLDGSVLSSIPADTDFNVCVNLTRNAENSGEVLLVAVYNNSGRLLDILRNPDFLAGTVLSGREEFIQRISQISGKQIAKIRVFILSGMDTIKPESNFGKY